MCEGWAVYESLFCRPNAVTVRVQEPKDEFLVGASKLAETEIQTWEGCSP